MKLISFKVQNFRSINYSGPISVDSNTALVGRNESGKSNLLLALRSLNPDGGIQELEPIKNFPRDRRIEECDENTEVLDTKWLLSEEEQSELVTIFPRAKDDHLSWLANEIAAIPHIKRLRIHSRLPVVLPERISHDFVEWFTALPLQKVLVLHANHANEMSETLKSRLNTLRERGVILLNQSVLLKGVNDSGDAISDLSETLFEAGVLPYYLHVLDKVQGASHFYVSDDEGRRIMKEVIKRLPGFLVPKLVREIGGQPGKTPIDLHLHP